MMARPGVVSKDLINEAGGAREAQDACIIKESSLRRPAEATAERLSASYRSARNEPRDHGTSLGLSRVTVIELFPGSKSVYLFVDIVPLLSLASSAK